MPRFDVLLTPDLYGGGYTVTVPALPGIVTHGRTIDEALANAQDAIECHTDGLSAVARAGSGARFDLIVVSMNVDIPGSSDAGRRLG